jgi:Zn-dependent hydrolases, including glyoxylases
MILEDDEVLLIDPNYNQDAVEQIKKNHIKKITILLTHEHFDHTSGVDFYRSMLPTVVICQKKCADAIMKSRNNRPLALLKMKTDDAVGIMDFYHSFRLYSIKADFIFESSYDMTWCGHRIQFLSMPGHSQGSSLVRFGDTHIFTGDYMIEGIPVILRYPGGSVADYKKITLPYLLALSAEYMVFPGHGEPYRRRDVIYAEDKFSRKK